MLVLIPSTFASTTALAISEMLQGIWVSLGSCCYHPRSHQQRRSRPVRIYKNPGNISTFVLWPSTLEPKSTLVVVKILRLFCRHFRATCVFI